MNTAEPRRAHDRLATTDAAEEDMTHPLFVPRWFFLITALATATLLAYGYYLQFHEGLEPCPMCIFQRLCYMAIAATGIIAATHGPARVATLAYCGLTTLFAGIGAAIAGRQVWLQHLPEDRIPECGPGLEFMLEVYPLAEVIRTALKGTGECATVDWTFAGLSIADWSLICFVLFSLAHILFGWRAFRHNGQRA